MKNNQYCVIMAGGHLNRFWPISREGMPGHFLDISGTGKSLVRMAYERCLGVVPEENILIITLGKFETYRTMYRLRHLHIAEKKSRCRNGGYAGGYHCQ